MNNTWHDILEVGYPTCYGRYLVADVEGKIRIRTYDPNIEIPFYKPNTPPFKARYWMDLPEGPGGSK